MPDTGYSPYGGWDTGSPIDNSGGGIDPSYASSLAAGGDFPGARQNLLGYLAGASTGANLGNPDYQVPSWLSWLAGHAGASGSLARNIAGRLVSGHEANVRSPGGGQTPEGLSGGYPYNFFSGPGASYGPANGPGTGLVDMGRGVASEWDGPESKPPGESTSTPSGGGKGKGGGGGGHALNWTPYQGITHQPSFVDWQPITPGTPGPYPPTRFVGGGGVHAPAAVAPPVIAPGGGRAHGGGGGGGGGVGAGSGRGGGAGSGHGAGQGPGRNPGSGPGSTNVNTNGGSGFGAGDPWSPGNSPVAPHVGQQLRENTRGGVDTNYLDYMTPGWLRDPTAGTTNTSGFPSPTLPAPQHGENFDSYMTRLHDSGFSSDDIFSMLGGGYGFSPTGGNAGPFKPDDPNGGSDWGWGWGTGPPTRGEYGYEFAANSHDSGLDMPEGSGYHPTAGLADGPAYVMRDGHRIRVDLGAPADAGGERSGGMSGGRGGGGPTPAEVASANATMSALMRPLY